MTDSAARLADDASYAVEVQRTHPGRLAIVEPVDPDDPAVANVVADWKKTAGTVGIRIMLTKEAAPGHRHACIFRF
jgi:L-fuconolactonase